MNKIHVLSIGYGRHMFVESNSERRRMQQCAAAVAAHHMIIFTNRRDQLQAQQVGTLTLHPTNSRHKLLMLFDAIRIARKILKSTDQQFVVTTQDPFATGIVGLVLQKFCKVKLVVQEHGDVFGTKYWRQESLYNQVCYHTGCYVLRQADVVRVVAQRVGKHVAAVGVAPEKIVQLPVAIDTTSFTPKHYDWDHLSQNEFRFLTVARLVPQKNVPLMLQAFKKAWQQNKQLRLTIVGTGSEQGAIEKLLRVQYQDVDAPVSLLGWSDDVAGLMRQADAYILTSNYEGWARVLIEAMVTHLPTVTTDVGCAGEVLLDSIHGLVVPLESEEQLVQAILRLSTDSVLYKSLVSNLQSLQNEQIPGTDITQYGQRWVETLTV